MKLAVWEAECTIGWRQLLLAGLFCLLSSVALAQSATSQGMAEQRVVSVTQVALGILSYARWPQEQAQLRLCIVGPTEYTDDLVKGTTQASGRTVIVRRLLADNLAIASDCDAAYSGKLTVSDPRTTPTSR